MKDPKRFGPTTVQKTFKKEVSFAENIIELSVNKTNKNLLAKSQALIF